jgi:hypothetical protein
MGVGKLPETSSSPSAVDEREAMRASGTGMLGWSVVAVRCRFADVLGGANDERRGGRKPAAFLASMRTWIASA